MSDPVPTDLRRAIGDLGPARRHLDRMLEGVLPASQGVLLETKSSVLRCVGRLERMDAAGHDMLEVLEACRQQFESYAAQHDAKGTVESAVKAEVNRAMVARITAAVTKAR